MEEWKEVFGQLAAPKGVFSTLGNHDYGDYVQWPSKAAKEANLNALKQVHSSMGWRLLMNENVSIEQGGAQIKLVGIENWGAKARFPKYGKMDQAMEGVDPKEVIILMSHDPSHWEAQVIIEYPYVDLMLSGHTHGMQFGLENPYFKWSPVQWVYKQWAGLYQQGAQQLYVNRGFGFLGYPGRVGIMPEITLLELI
jgi:predicted MPP superfamily phosphohydrolase